MAKYNQQSKQSTIIKACSINIGGYSTRSQFVLNKYVDEENMDFLAMQETLSADITKLELHNMNVFCDTNNAKNRGAALYINNKHSLTKLESISKLSKQIDSCWGLAVIHNKRIIIGSIYVKHNYKTAIDDVMKMLQAAQDKQKQLKASGIILTGDLNARHQSWGDRENNYYGKRLAESLDYTEFTICSPDTPTFLSVNGSSKIDLFIVSNNLVESVNSCKTDEEVHLHSGAPERGHVPVIVELQVNSPTINNQVTEKLDVENMNWEKWTEAIEEEINARETSLDTDNPYTIWNVLNGVITKATNQHGTFKKSCHHSKPYWTSTLTRLSKNLREARKKFIKRNTDDNYEALQNAKEAFDNERKLACSEFLISKAKQLNSAQARQFWKSFNKIFKKKSTQKIDPILSETNELLTETKDIEKCMFSVFFEAKHLITGDFDNIFYEEVNNIYNEIMEDADPIPQNHPFKKCNLYDPITVTEIKKAMKCNGKSVDNFGFHPKMLKHLGNKAIDTLEKLFNLCLSTNQWVWDGAEVVFLRKEGKDSYAKAGSYRPICITAYIGKLLESIIAKRLENYLQQNNLADPDQEGFSTGKNTIRYLNRLHLGIEADREKSLTILCLFVDFEKAFDSVWKKGLIYKLSQLGITGSILKLINHFLMSRKVALKVNGEIGDQRQSAEYGLPQGSALSPVLFKIFVNDFLSELNRNPNISVYKFADDGTVKISAKTSHQCLNMLEQVLEHLLAWTKKWRMKVNCDRNKTEVICFNTAEKNKDIIPESFSYGKETIRRVQETTVLGLKIDQDLTYIPHSQNILKSLHHRWATLCKYSNRHWGFNQNVMLYLVITLFLSKLSYAGHIWMTTVNTREIIQLWYHIIKSITGAVLNIKHNVAELILGIPPIPIQTKVNQIKHFLKINCQPILNDRYQQFLVSSYDESLKSPSSLYIIYKDLFKFLNWKIKNYPAHFNHMDRDILNNSSHKQYFSLSKKSCTYTKIIIQQYTDTVLWQETVKSQFQIDGYATSPTPSSVKTPIPKGTPRNTEVIVMSMFYKNNLLNQMLWNLSKVPSPLCSSCSLQEETPEHILFQCSSVNANLRSEAVSHYNRVNKISDIDEIEPYIGLLNARKDDKFIITCINIVKSLNLRESIVL